METRGALRADIVNSALKAGLAPNDRTRILLEAPVLRTLLSLAAPTVALMLFQAVVHSAEGYFVGFLGPIALAGISLSFPLVMLMTTMSAGAFGGGVSSAIARALGAGRREDAARLAGTALALSGLSGVGCTAGMLVFGRSIFTLLGAIGPALEAAIGYSDILFLGAVPFWLFQAAASCLRGSGNTSYPAVVGAVGGVITLAASPALIFGVGDWAGLGLAGAAWAVVAYNVVSALLLLAVFASRRSPFQSGLASYRPDWRLARTILRVAIPSALNTLQSNLTFLSLTALVAPFGMTAVAGYGMSGRLEYLLIPIVFGIGSALIPLVSANAAAGNVQRVRQATRAASILGAAAGALIGVTVALLPHAWIGLFTDDSAVLATGSSYLRIVGPAYFAFGGGLVLFFAAQGTGRVLPSLAAGFTRLTVAALGGYVATRHFGRGLETLYSVMSAGLLLYGLVMIYVTRNELGLTGPPAPLTLDDTEAAVAPTAGAVALP
jgi:putative MATE family efflux protein